MKVRVFAGLREAIGSAWVDSEAGTVGELRAELASLAPLALIKACAVSVNGERAGDDTAIAATDEVAVLPPVAGG